MRFENRSLLILALALASCSNPVEREVPLAAPEFPRLASPARGEAVAPSAIEFRWHPVSDADSVVLEIAADSDFAGLVYQANVRDTSLRIGHLFDAPRYYWRIAYVSKSQGQLVWSSREEFRLVDSTPDIEFRNLKVGQYSEWQGGYESWRGGPRMGMRVVAHPNDTFVVTQYLLKSGVGTDSSTAYWVSESGGLFYVGEQFPFTLLAKVVHGQEGFREGVLTTSQACTGLVPTVPKGCFTARIDSDTGGSKEFGANSTFLEFTWPMEFESLSNTRLVLDPRSRLMQTVQFGFYPLQNPQFTLVLK